MRIITSTRRIKKLVFLLFLSSTMVSFAQNYAIQFLNESINIPENMDSFSWNAFPENTSHKNGHYAWMQFYDMPTQNEQEYLKSVGVTLIDYIPNNTYLIYAKNVPENALTGLDLRAISPILPAYKLNYDIKSHSVGDWAVNGNAYILNVVVHNETKSTTMQDLLRLGITITKSYKGANLIEIMVDKNAVLDVASLPTVKWIEPLAQPGEPEDTRGRSLHRANTLDTQSLTGRNYTGDGIGVMVRDDGIVGPHIDFQGRIDNSAASGSGPTHGDGVAGILAGAGNLDPDKRGMAAGADVYVVNYVPSHLDTPTTNLIESGKVLITNSSYSDGCNAGNTVNTNTVDMQSNTYPSLLHVFSGGNSNNNDCGYGAGNQWGNITGGHKQGKNVIATANVNFAGTLASSSSRGPAFDGRIKPDITANGQGQLSTDENNGYLTFGGTSGAAPGIAGVSAQLYEAYRELYNELPEAALVKATLLNTASDYGNTGPDFKFGWGMVNALRAAMLIEDGRFLSDEIAQDESNAHTIMIPENTQQVRFMVYWRDREASAGVTPALVNDIDMTVQDPSANTLQPWILNPSPNPTTLNQPATTGEDHLNNMEQVLINNPEAGEYTINLSGFNVPFGPQEYYVVYEVIANQVTVTYPFGDEKLEAGTQEVIRWDALASNDTFTVEYSINDGVNWISLGTSPSSSRYRIWNVPVVTTGNALVRVTRGDDVSISESAFSISPKPTNVEITQVCPDEYSLTWQEVAGANEYDVYQLGEKYMEVVGSTATTSATLPLSDLNEPLWVAVVAKNTVLGWESKRTIAVGGTTGLINCTLSNDLAIEDLNLTEQDFLLACDNQPVVVSVDVRNTGIQDQANFMMSYQLNDGPMVQEMYTQTLASGEQILYEFSEPISIDTNGDYNLTVSLNLDTDENEFNDEVELDFYALVSSVSLNVDEDFENTGAAPDGWTILNGDDDITWEERNNVVGLDNTNSRVIYMDNYTYNANGEEDILATVIYDLADISDGMLSFDLAKAQYSAQFTDSFRVDISEDCGENFQQIFFKTGLELSTVGSYVTSIWTPSSSSQWRAEIIDLSSYNGSQVMLRFVNINGYGNSTFIDNVRLEASLSVADRTLTDHIKLFPNPASSEIRLAVPAGLNVTGMMIYNQLGQEVLKRNNLNAEEAVDVSGLASGLYFVSIEANGVQTSRKLLID